MTLDNVTSATTGLPMFTRDQLRAIQDHIRSAYDQGYNDMKCAVEIGNRESCYRGREISQSKYDDLLGALRRLERSVAKKSSTATDTGLKSESTHHDPLKWSKRGVTFYAETVFGQWKVWFERGEGYYQSPSSSHGRKSDGMGLYSAFDAAQIEYETMLLTSDRTASVDAVVAPQATIDDLEIDDGCAIFRMGSTSMTICAESVGIYDTESGKPAVKVPLTYESVSNALGEVQSSVGVAKAKAFEPSADLVIKALEWEPCLERSGYGSFIFKAYAQLGVFRILKGSQSRYEVYLNDSPISGSYDDEADAKDYAQVYFEERVRASVADLRSLAKVLGFVRKAGLRSLSELNHTSIYPEADLENGYTIPVYIGGGRLLEDAQKDPVDDLITDRKMTPELRMALRAIAGIKASLYVRGTPTEEGVAEMYQTEIVDCLLGVNFEDEEIKEAIEAGVPMESLERQAAEAKKMLLDQAEWIALSLKA